MNASLPSTNPFASARIRPGTLPFLFRPGETADQLVDHLQMHAWSGQIVGPHGTGKSTLVETLVPLIAARGRIVVRVPLPGREGNSSLTSSVSASPSTVFIIDGFEQFGWAKRFAWRGYCRWRRCGLLVTTHRDLGLPTLYTTTVDSALAQQIVDRLLRGEVSNISAADVTQALDANRGNLRDALFALYDTFELRRVANSPHQVSQR